MKSEFKAKIDKWFEDNTDKMLQDLSSLIAINSIRSAPLEGKPYGEGCAKVLDKAMEIFARDGFECKNFDNHVITAELNGKEPVLGILAHLDTVAVTEDWNTNPFEMVVKDGITYGRGVSDDKGPAMSAYYAMKAVRDICPELGKGCRLILGAAEETGEPDLEYYQTKEKYPPMVFTPDGDYPIVNFEKGRYCPYFAGIWEKENAGKNIVSFKGGETANIVPQKAFAVVSGLSLAEVQSYAEKIASLEGITVSCKEATGGVEIAVIGKSAHASTPELGVNPQTALLEMLCAMPLDDTASVKAVRGLNKLFPHGDVSGKAIGVAHDDETTGSLTLNFGVLQMNETGFSANCDIRMPLGCTDENTFDVVNSALTDCGFTLTDTSEHTSHHYTEPDGVFVQTLLDVYENYTGLKGECLAIGGGTYVHDIEGGVAFGCTMPGYDTRMHGDDERMPIADIVVSAKIFAQAIIELCM